ncbi:hypothetical protein RFI_25465 [Reticulomyxa filosa]|uniref:Uncharacterized protein n=1 Tax=Reticulomyxa filosa TaxID=46433 RepID=X6MDH0_RETFI|nr:hypothetical protein RFI_25465 [Reticulomyxa filosa]|eukprot:ETO11909.1 hypothetical protein RFI_25465 [Reticulomyxa filosa]
MRRHSSTFTPSRNEDDSQHVEEDEAVTPPAEDDTVKPQLGWGDSTNDVRTFANNEEAEVNQWKHHELSASDRLTHKSMLRMEAYTNVDPNEPMAYSEYGINTLHKMDVSFDDDADEPVQTPKARASLNAYSGYDDNEDEYVRPDVINRLNQVPKNNHFLKDPHIKPNSKQKQSTQDKDDVDSDDDIDPTLDVEQVKRQALNEQDFKVNLLFVSLSSLFSLFQKTKKIECQIIILHLCH